MSALRVLATKITDPQRVRWPALALTSGAVLLIGYLWVAALISIVLATAGGTEFSLVTALGAALPGWLAAHGCPLWLPGGDLGVLPLGPGILMMWLIAAASAVLVPHRTPCRLARVGGVVAAMSLSHAVAGASIAFAFRDMASPGDAFGACGMTALLASTAGAGSRRELFRWLQDRADPDLWSGLRAGALAVAAAVGCGSVLVFLSLCVSVPELMATLARMGTAGDAFGSALASLLYLPNAAVAGWSFAAGTGLSIGAFTVDPTQLTPGPLPQFPLLALLPANGPTPAWFAAMLLPIGVGALAGFQCLDGDSTPLRRLKRVGLAALVAALGVALLASVCGGRLGLGVVSLHPGLVGLATFCWVAIPAALVVLVAEERDPGAPAVIPTPRTESDSLAR